MFGSPSRFVNYFEKFERENPGIFLSGNYRGGISVGDCIKSSYKNFEKIRDYLNKDSSLHSE